MILFPFAIFIFYDDDDDVLDDVEAKRVGQRGGCENCVKNLASFLWIMRRYGYGYITAEPKSKYKNRNSQIRS